MEETFHWLLSNFLISMLGKKPISIVTDVDDAMRNVVMSRRESEINIILKYGARIRSASKILKQ